MFLFPVFLAAAHASPVEISVPDENVKEVILVCGDQQLRQPVRNGKAKWPERHENCQVRFDVHLDKIDRPGFYTCSLADGCKVDDVPHRPLTAQAGRVNVVFIHDTPDGMYLELTCPAGKRERQNIDYHTVVFDGITQGCQVQVKGTTPAKWVPESDGTFYCQFVGSILSCEKQEP